MDISCSLVQRFSSAAAMDSVPVAEETEKRPIYNQEPTPAQLETTTLDPNLSIIKPESATRECAVVTKDDRVGQASITVSSPTELPPPVQVPAPLSGPPDVITKVIYRNARHRTSSKKQVVIQTCEICNIELIGQVVIDAHMKGSKHAKKLKAKELLSNLIGAGQVHVDPTKNETSGVFKCDVCNVPLNSSQQLEVHYAGAKHKTKASEIAQQKVQDVSAASGNEDGTNGCNEAKALDAQTEKPKSLITNPLDLVCTICSISVNSPQQLEQHLNSKKHKDRESGRAHQRPGPYNWGSRGGSRVRGGLGSQGRGGKQIPSKFTNLSNSFKSAGYSNSFIKPEGGVTLPPNCGTNKTLNQSAASQQNATKKSNLTGPYKIRGNFGSITPFVNTDNSHESYNTPGGIARTNWVPASTNTGGNQGYSGFDCEQYGYGYGYGYGYSGYENADGYGGYGMIQSGPPPPPPPPPPPAY